MNKVRNLEDFLKAAREKHGDKYDYSKCVYESSKKKMIIICPEHGEFLKTSSSHLRKDKDGGCPTCSKLGRFLTKDEFIEKSKIHHGDFYDYSNVVYKGDRIKVCIICPEHGEFWQAPNKHMYGQGCPKCRYIKSAKSNTHSFKRFMERAKAIHGDKYEYDKKTYVNDRTKIKIFCPEHGEFWKTPNNHTNKLLKQGCPECGNLKSYMNRRLDTETFIERAISVHGNRYDYSKVNYILSDEKVCIICPTHGEFWQRPSNHYHLQHGCSECIVPLSVLESEIREFIYDIYKGEVVLNDRTILKGRELDIILPTLNIAIEANGVFWHTERHGRDSKYHLNKTMDSKEAGLMLIHIFEDEWFYQKDIVKSRLKHIIGLNNNKIYARKCIIKEVSNKESKIFLNKNHLQGNINSKYKYGLYYNEELVSLMTFGSYRISMGRQNVEGEYEMLRFTNKLNTTVVGGASKLLKHFIREVKPTKIISYSDLRWGSGNLYKQLGFEFVRYTPPNYFYVNGDRRESRFKYRKDKLVAEGYDPNMTEREIMEMREFYRIYDCGSKLFELKL